MTSPCDFQDYLQSLCTTYKQWWEENAFIDEIKDAWFEFVLDGKTKSNQSADEQSTTEEQRQEITKPVLRLIEDYRHQKILIVGDPGAGKSTLLKRLLRDAAEKAQKDEQAPIPVFVELKNYKTTGDRVGIRGLILESLESHDPVLDEDALKQLLTGKRLLLLADGLNELSYESAKAELKNLCRHQAIIATSRFTNSWWDIDRKLEIQPLTSQQVKQFLEERLPNRDRAEVEKLGERVKDLGQTPLMVWMLYSIFQAKKETPTTRGEVYRSFTALYVERVKTGLDLAESRFLLSKLAFEMMQSQKPDDPTHFSLDMTEVDAQNRLGSAKTLNQLLSLHLLQASGQPGNRKICFCHQTLQEYYAAEALLEQLQKHPEWLEKTPEQQWTHFQQDYLNYVKWTEAIALMLGLPEASESYAKRLVELALDADLMLRARLAGEVKLQFQEQTVESLNQLMVQQNLPEWLKIELLGKTQSEEAIEILSQVIEQGEAETRWRAIKALGKIRFEKTTRVLIQLLKYPDPLVRRNAANELGQLNLKVTIPALIIALKDDPDPEVRWKAAYALGEIGSVEAISGLCEVLQNLGLGSATRSAAAYALGEIGSGRVLPELLVVLQDSNHNVRFRAVEALGKIGSKEVIPELLELAEKDPNRSVRRIARKSLNEIRQGKEAINATHKAIQKLYSDLQQQQTDSLEQHLSTKTLDEILDEIKSPDPGIRQSVVKVLGQRDFSQVVHILINVLKNDPNSNVCWSAAKILHQNGCDKAVNALLNALEDTNYMVRVIASEALGRIKSNSIAQYLPHLVLISSNTGEETFGAIATIQSRCGFYNYEIYQYAQNVNKLENSSDFISQLYKDLDRVIYEIEKNPEVRQKDGEDRLTIEIVGSLRSSGYSANHDCKIGGHADITVEKNDFIWLGEAKIYKDNNYLWEGFLQLTTRYSIGNKNQSSGGLLIYIFDEDAKSVMEKWQTYLSNKNLSNYSYRPCELNSCAFISSHKHQRSGLPFHVRHIPVLLHFSPQDKSGRQSGSTK